MGEITLSNIEDYRDPIRSDSTVMRELRERAERVRLWGWKEGVLVDLDTQESVAIQPDPGWGDEPENWDVAGFPYDIQMWASKVSTLQEAYDKVRSELETRLRAEEPEV